MTHGQPDLFTASGRSVLMARQASMLNGFRFLVADMAGRPVGELNWPNMAQARNARLKWHGNDRDAGTVKIQCGAQLFLVEFEYLNRSWENDARYFLTTPSGATTPAAPALATAKRVSTGGIKHASRMLLESPVAAHLDRLSRWPRQRFALQANRQILGTIEETRWLSLVREVRVDLPAHFCLPTQLFVLFLALHLLQTQA